MPPSHTPSPQHVLPLTFPFSGCGDHHRATWPWGAVRGGLRTLLTVVMSVTVITAAWARTAVVATAEDFTDADFHPGLLATYRQGEQQVQRIDDTLSFRWNADAPDPRLPAGPFSGRWESWLLVKTPGVHRFHAAVTGSLKIVVDGTTVLHADNHRGFLSSDPVTLTAGDHEWQVTYESPVASDKPQAALSVFWSGDSFTLEPLPADVLYCEERHDAQFADHGAAVADAFRCAACHSDRSSLTLPVLPAPALDRVRGSQPVSVLKQRLQNPRSVVPNSHMPDFGWSETQAEQIAAFLHAVSQSPHQAGELKRQAEDAAAGQKLLLSTGCVACHNVSSQTGELPSSIDPYDAPDLASVGQRRTAAWLDRWLRDPDSLNRDHRMPQFELSKDERRQLVAALVGELSLPDTLNPLTASAEQVAAGRQLVKDANCAACHTIPGMEAAASAIVAKRPVTDSAADSPPTASCFVAGGTGRPQQPHFALPELQQTSLAAWQQSGPLVSAANAVDRGGRVLARNRCLQCHDRDADRGLSLIANQLQTMHPALDGQSQGLVPPSLTAVGDKLQTDYLATAVQGKQKPRRLPWLLVQMPQFRHTDQETAWLLQHFQTKDLIPASADSARQDVLSHVDVSGQQQASTEDLLLGNQLTGAGGFNCVACHQAGPFQPRNVALGTRGSDLMTMGARLRPRYFQRWMKNPIRVVAGIEMPAIRRGMPDVLEGSLPRQLGVIWTALSDPRFTPPTVTSQFEQLAFVSPDDRPLILRDVFTIGTDSRTFDPVARAFAVGLPNGHNVLIDLDTMNLRLWTYGEFARQRTEGKSWYWDMPGTVIRQPQRSASVQTLRTPRQQLSPVMDEGRVCETLSYGEQDGIVRIRSRSWYRDPAAPESAVSPAAPHAAETAWASPADPLIPVVFEHTLAPQSAGGFRYTIEVIDAPADWQLDGPDALVRSLGGSDSLIASDVAVEPLARGRNGIQLQFAASSTLPPRRAPRTLPPVLREADELTSTPGFRGVRLPLAANTMPTAIAWLPDGRMAFTSLKGHVWLATDTDGDGLPDETSLFEEGLAAPFGILAEGNDLLVAHKPEILRLIDSDGDGRADQRDVVASGWGYSDNYHDWTSGLVRDEHGHLYVGLGSDYSQKKRPVKNDRWRGGVVKVDPSGVVTPFSLSMRYPMDIAIDAHGHVFATDNQGVQNTFNEINHLQPGRHYGVPSRHQPTDNLQAEEPAVMVPHPWSRSVNSILFLPADFPIPGLRGHGVGCEYDSRFLMRFTIQNVNGTLQGASYRFSRPNQEAGGANFIGPICSAVSANGELYIGSIWDSGWQGGRNTGGIARLTADPDSFLNGIQEVRAIKGGFEVEFFEPVPTARATNASLWNIQAFTRTWGGSYATPDSERFTAKIESATIDASGRIVTLRVSDQRAGFLYDIAAPQDLSDGVEMWPTEAHYSMKVVP